MKKLFMIAVLVLLSVCVMAPQAKAGEVDMLIQKLVEKGILTPGEGQVLITETKEEVKKQIASGKYENLPTWLQTMKLKGDFRFRYQFDRHTSTSNENRARMRVRLGVEAKANEKMKVAVGIATGRSGDPRSTNITLGQTGDNTSADRTNVPGSFKNIVLDYAYGEYAFNNNVSLAAGKFSNPLWRVTDLLWDGDINPEGVNVKLTHKLSSSMDLFMNNLLFILDENTSVESKYPMMGAIQPGVNYKISDTLGLKGAVTGYFFSGVEKRAKFGGSGSTNTFNRVGSTDYYKYNYNSVNPSMEFSIKEPFGGIVPSAKIFSEGVFNVSKDVKGARGGFAAGLTFGADRVSSKGDWQAKLIYAKLSRDAWMDIFPDSDRYSGKTNMKSYEAIFSYGLGKNTSLDFDYYYSQSLDKVAASSSGPAGYRPSHMLQVDWNLKF